MLLFLSVFVLVAPSLLPLGQGPHLPDLIPVPAPPQWHVPEVGAGPVGVTQSPTPVTTGRNRAKGTDGEGGIGLVTRNSESYFENAELTSLIGLRVCNTILLGAIFQYDPISPKRGHTRKQ